jgi:hypothetical protein
MLSSLEGRVGERNTPRLVLTHARFMESNRDQGGAHSDSLIIGFGRGMVTPRYAPGMVKEYAHGISRRAQSPAACRPD